MKKQTKKTQGKTKKTTKKTKAGGKKKTSKSNPCWPGFERVPGTKPFTKGSCAPIKKTKKKSKKKTKKVSK